MEIAFRRALVASALALSLGATACADDGKNGKIGPEGEQGQPGERGLQGESGLSTLVKSSPLAAGSACANGGTKIEIGLDADGNGELRENEVDPGLTQTICNGATGPQGEVGPIGVDGLAALVRSVDEAPGENCVTGGTRIEMGIDLDRDLSLGDEEVAPELTRFVCNGLVGAQGVPGIQGIQGPQGIQGDVGPQGPQGLPGADGWTALAATSVEPAGANCTTGGTRIETGLDQDDDGILDPAEIDLANTRYVCNGLDGAAGPQGEQGIPGIQGPQGFAGVNGLDGLTPVVTTTLEAAGANCADGGVKLETGLDADRSGVIDATEITTRFLCNGAVGATGPAGPQGPMGPAANSLVYGDGSAGPLTVGGSATLDLTAPNAFAQLPAGSNLQFTDITINGNLIVPSGTVLRATGTVLIHGTITVQPGTIDNGAGGHAGVSRAASGPWGAGLGLTPVQAAQVRPGLVGGGAGSRTALGQGGEGGGMLVIAAMGGITLNNNGRIVANGGSGFVSQTAGVGAPGVGGGAGGVVILASRGTIGNGGIIRANGGNGSAGWDGDGIGSGGGGGGGGGIVRLVAPTIITAGTVEVNAGAAGANAGTGTLRDGGSGGACGGNGGLSGGTARVAQAGTLGQVVQTRVALPEAVLF